MDAYELSQRLAAILAADAVGYSRLMAGDERATVEALDAARSIFKAQVESNQGRVVDMAGDSVLAVFHTAIGAVQAALAIQENLANLAADVPKERQLNFRIGLHLGDVIEKADGTVYGDGVNIASRLEGLAEPGGVMVSQSIRVAVRGKVDTSFEDGGDQSIKNIPEPVRVYRVRWTHSSAAAADPTSVELDLSLPDKPSIAVLPFTNMSGDPEQEYFIDGVTEDIITELSRFHSLFVIARNSTFSYKGKSVDIRRVGKELGVRFVLEGSIRKSANRVRVTAQLIDSLTGTHVWADRYDRVLEDIFAVQEQLTLSIVAAIAPMMDEAAMSIALRKRPDDLNAYQLAVRARANMNRSLVTRDLASREQGLREARAALAIDPSCVLALQMLAFGLLLRLWTATAINKREVFKEGLDAATQAIDLDRTDSLGYTVRSALLAVSGRDGSTLQAVDDARHAHSLNRNDYRALHQLGWTEMLSGDHAQAIEHLHQALRLNPRDPWTFSAYANLADAYFFLSDYRRGLDCALRAITEAQGAGTTYHDAALCYVGLGEIEKAGVALKKAQLAAPEFINGALSGRSVLRRPEDRRKYHVFLRIAAGLEDPNAAEALR